MLLNGQHGNTTISWDGGNFPVMTTGRSDGIAAGLHEMREWKSAHQVSWIRAIKRQMVNPYLPIFRILRSHLPRQSEPWANYSAINPVFARRLNILPHVIQAQKDSALAKLDSPEREHYASFRAGRSWVGSLLQGTGAGYALEIRDPTIDQRVLEFCFSIPVDQFRGAGEDRRLIRRECRDCCRSRCCQILGAVNKQQTSPGGGSLSGRNGDYIKAVGAFTICWRLSGFAKNEEGLEINTRFRERKKHYPMRKYTIEKYSCRFIPTSFSRRSIWTMMEKKSIS